MNALLINGSPNARGSTFTALSEVASTLQENGITTEIIHVGHLPIRGCIACRKCKTTGVCVFSDIVNEVNKKFEVSEGIVLGSPVYYASAAGTMVSFSDRLFYSGSFEKRMKVGAAVISTRRSGITATYDQLNKYFTISNMPVASSQYWNGVHGNNADEAQQDLEGMQTMRVLGRNMAFLMKSIADGKEKYGMPEKEDWQRTNFIR